MGQTAEESFDTLSLLPLVPNVAKNFWREATKNFASKAVQRQQGEELLRVSGKLDILLLLCALAFSLQVVLLGQSLGFLLGLPLTGQ